MKRLLFCLLVLSAAIPASAQYLPLILDQTIQLPYTSDVWDVMPHRNGYYIWAESVAPPFDQAKIYWDSTNGDNLDSLSLAIRPPGWITCFFDSSLRPLIFVADPLTGQGMFSCGIYRLRDGQRIGRDWQFRGLCTGDDEWRTCYVNFCVAAATAEFPPPAKSKKFICVVKYLFQEFDNPPPPVPPFHNEWSNEKSVLIPNLMSSDSHAFGPVEFARYWDFAFDGVRPITSSAGADESHNQYGYINGHLRACQTVILEDTLQSMGCYTIGYAYPQPQRNTTSYPISCTVRNADHVVFSLTKMDSDFVCISSQRPGQTCWVRRASFSFWFAVDYVPGNGTEEFLCYDRQRKAFDVLDATNGYIYGTTDTISIPVNGGARIIGRYDSTSRRLAFRDGQQLKLYRFGQYLAAGDRNAPVPSLLALLCYPNPFNPSTTISFSLERETEITLSIFDLTGRRVRTLAEGRWNAGAHEVKFDGAALPSGLYFARLQAGGFAKTQKLVMIK